MEIAVASRKMQFNIGVTAWHDVTREMEIPAGCFTEAGSERKNNKSEASKYKGKKEIQERKSENPTG